MADNLAVCYEELFTAIDRLNGGRQAVTDAGTFRQQIRDALALAERSARGLGYPPEDIRLATFAVIALLDSAILRLQNPVFADWMKNPLGQEYFGSFNAGETFFTSIQRLLHENDSPQLADLLEIYELCILLGFQGRHGISSQGELRNVRETLADRIRRIRGTPEVSPHWKPAGIAKRETRDPLLRALVWTAVLCCGLTILLFVFYLLRLHGGVSDLTKMAGHA